jgi:putative transposase
VSRKYGFIDAEKANYPITKMCEWIDVSRSGFHEWRDRAASATAQRQERLKVLIEHIFADSDGTYGYRRVHAQLVHWGVDTSAELVRRLMRRLGLVACQPRPWRPVTTVAGDAAAIPDLVDRDFTAAAPGAKLVGDITYSAQLAVMCSPGGVDAVLLLRRRGLTWPDGPGSCT